MNMPLPRPELTMLIRASEGTKTTIMVGNPMMQIRAEKQMNNLLTIVNTRECWKPHEYATSPAQINMAGGPVAA